MVVVSKSILPPNNRVKFVETKSSTIMGGASQAGENMDGGLTNAGMNMLQQIQTLINGLTPLVPCTAEYSSENEDNLFTLTPFVVSPRPNTAGSGNGNARHGTYYVDYCSFAFIAPSTSTAEVNAKVGELEELPVYKDNGATRADTDDIKTGLFYILYYVSDLNGFVLK